MSEERLRVLVVDDELPGRRRLEDLLGDRSTVELLPSARSGARAAAAIRELRPDLVFLDVQMPGKDGFDVIREVGSDAFPPVVFVTAHDEHALAAFDVHAVDYLLKPFDDERFEEAFQRAVQTIRARDAGSLEDRLRRLLAATLVDDGVPDGESGSGKPLRHLALPQRQGARIVATERIDWIEAEDVYVRVHVAQDSYLLRETLSHLERSLDPEQFVRIHRSTIVNLGRIHEIHEYFRGEQVAVLADGTRLKVARGRRGTLSARFRPRGSEKGSAR